MATNDGKERSCIVVLHDDRISPDDVLCGRDILGVGDLAYLKSPNTKELLIKPSRFADRSDEISLHVSLAERYGFAHRTLASIEIVDDVDSATATHMELLFRDQHLSRADMWQLMGSIDSTVLYRGQSLKYLGTQTAEVQHIYHAGEDVDSAYITHPATKPIFRSGSARFTILIEVSQEMVENWSCGDLMYERLTDGFLTELFTRWQDLRVRHQMSVVLFGRRAARSTDTTQYPHNAIRGDDFFHILASEMPSDSWMTVLRKIKQHFNEHHLPKSLSLSTESNMLEAINLAAMDFADDLTDARLVSTGTSIIAITAGTGLFDADHALLKHTTELLVGNSIGVDIVSLAPKPLHPVPLFRYDHRGSAEYALPHWVDISFWRRSNDDLETSWTLDESEEPFQTVSIPFLSDSLVRDVTDEAVDAFDRQIFSHAISSETERLTPYRPSVSENASSLQAVKEQRQIHQAANNVEDSPTQESTSARTLRSDSLSSSKLGFQEELRRPKKPGLPPHPLMQSGRKISLGPKGLTSSKGAASTIVTTEYVQQERESPTSNQMPAAEPSGIAMQIRASLARKQSSVSLTSQRISDPDVGTTSRPIDIHISGASGGQIPDLARVVEEGINKTTLEATLEHERSLSRTLTPGHNMLSTIKEAPNEALDMLSPWVVLLNPCNPRRDNMRIASQYRKWQHIFPRAVSSGSFKWSSMTCPAALPLTSEYRPSASELEKYYSKIIRRHVTHGLHKSVGENARTGLERLIDERLCQGFQIVSIVNSGSEDTHQKEDRPIVLALGKVYHELQRFSDLEVQVVQYEPDFRSNGHDYEMERYISNYRPTLRTSTGASLSAEVSFHPLTRVEDWSAFDEHILGLVPLPDTSTCFKVSLVLIPVELPRHEQDASTRPKELTDDERRIEGIQRLTQMWQRQRHFTTEDQQHQASLARETSKVNTERDPNPLAIEYETRDPSVAVNQRGSSLSAHLEDGEVLTPLFAESEKHHSSNFDVTKLVKQMQETPPYGVDMRDRRWLAVTHVKCFRGDEMTTWLLGVFKDLELRGDAVAVGNELMSRGIFTHVRQKHKFRDGHYFYQIMSSHRTSIYPDTTSLFSKVPWRSIPSTPIAESITSPISRPVSTESNPSSTSTPTMGPAQKKEILLSQILQYNVDPSNKSDHSQIISLHYDRIHNPENCYHIYLEWLGASAKLVQVAVNRWASLVEGHGLKLVQIPSYEVAKVREHHPFDQPEPIKLAIKPPEKGLATPFIEPQSLSPRGPEVQFAYHKALLRRAGFALDYEAANSFSTKLNVRYSWGLPTFTYTQFLHKTGLVLAQIVGDETADFLILPNRLVPKRPSNAGSARLDDPDVTEAIIESFRDLCNDGEELGKFYQEAANERRRMPPPSPYPGASLGADFDIPPMQLPPHLMHRMQLRNIG